MTALEKALEKCIELGKILAETEEFKRMKQAEYTLLHDEEARKLVEHLQQLQQQCKSIEMSGQKLPEEKLNEIKDVEKNALANPVVRMSHEANTEFQKIMFQISAKIRQGIKENSPPEEEE
jgi:cell fate (sporulation/competence/biofilm development) regulator YlbF (YheA/YmcA/DUF963 family)